jgi:hypothetical protein
MFSPEMSAMTPSTFVECFLNWMFSQKSDVFPVLMPGRYSGAGITGSVPDIDINFCPHLSMICVLSSNGRNVAMD